MHSASLCLSIGSEPDCSRFGSFITSHLSTSFCAPCCLGTAECQRSRRLFWMRANSIFLALFAWSAFLALVAASWADLAGSLTRRLGIQFVFTFTCGGCCGWIRCSSWTTVGSQPSSLGWTMDRGPPTSAHFLAWLWQDQFWWPFYWIDCFVSLIQSVAISLFVTCLLRVNTRRHQMFGSWNLIDRLGFRDGTPPTQSFQTTSAHPSPAAAYAWPPADCGHPFTCSKTWTSGVK